MTETKYCKRCDRTLQIDEFHKNKNSIDGKAFYCKNCSSEYGKQYRSTINGIFTLMKGRAKFHQLKEVKITFEEFSDWYLSQPRVCCYCGLPEKDLPKINDPFLNPVNRHSVDCKDNYLGCCKDNMVLACRRCNYLKNDFFTYEQMIEIGERYVKPRWEKTLNKKI